MLGAPTLPLTGRVAPKARGGVIYAPKKAFYDRYFSHFTTPTPLGCADRPSPQGGGFSRPTSEANARLLSYAKVSHWEKVPAGQVPKRNPYFPNIPCTTLSPGAIPSLRAIPALTSSTA